MVSGLRPMEWQLPDLLQAGATTARFGGYAGLWRALQWEERVREQSFVGRGVGSAGRPGRVGPGRRRHSHPSSPERPRVCQSVSLAIPFRSESKRTAASALGAPPWWCGGAPTLAAIRFPLALATAMSSGATSAVVRLQGPQLRFLGQGEGRVAAWPPSLCLWDEHKQRGSTNTGRRVTLLESRGPVLASAGQCSAAFLQPQSMSNAQMPPLRRGRPPGCADTVVASCRHGRCHTKHSPPCSETVLAGGGLIETESVVSNSNPPGKVQLMLLHRMVDSAARLGAWGSRAARVPDPAALPRSLRRPATLLGYPPRACVQGRSGLRLRGASGGPGPAARDGEGEKAAQGWGQRAACAVQAVVVAVASGAASQRGDVGTRRQAGGHSAAAQRGSTARITSSVQFQFLGRTPRVASPSASRFAERIGRGGSPGRRAGRAVGPAPRVCVGVTA